MKRRLALLPTLVLLIVATATPMRAQMGSPTPQMQAVLDAVASFQQPPIPELSPGEARNTPSIPYWLEVAAARQGASAMPEAVGMISGIEIPSGDSQILARVYTPAGSGPFPVIVYYHGGGWVIANLDTYDNSARALTNASGAVVVSVAYRLAPENPFPTPMNDAYAAYQWVVNNAATLQGDPAQVAVAGESAGGNLAAVVSMRARDEGFPMPVHQLLVYPVTNYAFDTASYNQYADAMPLNRDMMMWFWANYLPNADDGANPYASPLRAPDLSGLPPATIILAEIDPLQSEGMAYAERLQAAGVPTDVRVFPGVTHEFFGMGALVPEGRAAVSTAGADLQASFDEAAMRAAGVGD